MYKRVMSTAKILLHYFKMKQIVSSIIANFYQFTLKINILSSNLYGLLADIMLRAPDNTGQPGSSATSLHGSVVGIMLIGLLHKLQSP